MSDRQRSTIRVVAVRQPFALFESSPWQPPSNMYETDKGILLVADLAGITPEDLHVYVHPAQIQIRRTRQVTPPAGLRRIHRLEIANGPFQIELPLAIPVDPEHTQAQYSNGLLAIWLPYADGAAQRTVVIRLGEGGV